MTPVFLQIHYLKELFIRKIRVRKNSLLLYYQEVVNWMVNPPPDLKT